jgi:hypothetical protein
VRLRRGTRPPARCSILRPPRTPARAPPL